LFADNVKFYLIIRKQSFKTLFADNYITQSSGLGIFDSSKMAAQPQNEGGGGDAILLGG